MIVNRQAIVDPSYTIPVVHSIKELQERFEFDHIDRLINYEEVLDSNFNGNFLEIRFETTNLLDEMSQDIRLRESLAIIDVALEKTYSDVPDHDDLILSTYKFDLQIKECKFKDISSLLCIELFHEKDIIKSLQHIHDTLIEQHPHHDYDLIMDF